MANVGGGGKKGKPKSTGNPVKREPVAALQPKPAAKPAPPKDEKVVIRGVTFIVKPNGTIIGPGGQVMPKGTKIDYGTVQGDGSRKPIDLNGPGNTEIKIEKGRVVIRQVPSKTERANQLVTGEKPQTKPATPAPAPAKSKPARSGDSNRQSTGGGGAGHAGHAGPQGHEHKGKYDVASSNLNRTGVLWTRLSAMIAAAPGGIKITSGERSAQRQKELWEQALKKYGDPEIADNWVARPGGSQHEHGNAADLQFANDAVRKWFHANAHRFGLHFPLSNEAWHIEVVEARGGKLHAAAIKAGVKPAVRVGNSKRVSYADGKTPTGEQQLTAMSGTGGGGTGGGGTSAPVTSADMLAGNVALPGTGSGPNGEMTADDFGFAASFFNSDPALKKLLTDAIAGDWTAEKFAVEFQKTEWYTKHSPAAREWIALNHNDPAAARRRLEVTIADIRQVALQMGADVDDNEARALAVQSLTLGMSPTELSKRVGLHVSHREEGDFRGEAGVNFTALQQKALAYGVPVTDLDLSRWVRELAAQNKTEQDFDLWVKTQAKILYPALERQIDSGLTPQDVANLYVNTMAETLEIDPNSVDWAKDPLIKRAMSHKAPDGKEVGAMALWEFEQELKKDPRWLKTKQATSSFMDVAGTVLRDWGVKF